MATRLFVRHADAFHNERRNWMSGHLREGRVVRWASEPSDLCHADSLPCRRGPAQSIRQSVIVATHLQYRYSHTKAFDAGVILRERHHRRRPVDRLGKTQQGVDHVAAVVRGPLVFHECDGRLAEERDSEVDSLPGNRKGRSRRQLVPAHVPVEDGSLRQRPGFAARWPVRPTQLAGHPIEDVAAQLAAHCHCSS